MALPLAVVLLLWPAWAGAQDLPLTIALVQRHEVAARYDADGTRTPMTLRAYAALGERNAPPLPPGSVAVRRRAWSTPSGHPEPGAAIKAPHGWFVAVPRGEDTHLEMVPIPDDPRLGADPRIGVRVLTPWLRLEHGVLRIDPAKRPKRQATVPMAVASHNSPVYDATSGNSAAFALSYSWSHTTTGSNRGLLVWSVIRASTTTTMNVKYNGFDMTPQAAAGGGNNMRLYSLIAPDSGAHNVEITLSDADGNALVGMTGSYTGVDQTTGFSGVVTNLAASGTNPTVDVTSATGDMVVAGIMVGTQVITFTQGTGSVERWDSLGTFIEEEAGAATVTVNATMDSDDLWRIIAINVKAADGVTPPTTTPKMLLLGVGP